MRPLLTLDWALARINFFVAIYFLASPLFSCEQFFPTHKHEGFFVELLLE